MVNGATAYEVTLSGGGSAQTKTTANARILFTGLVPNRSYRAAVVALNATEKSDTSVDFLTCTSIPVPDSPVISGLATAGLYGVLVAWDWSALLIDISNPVRTNIIRQLDGQIPASVATNVNQSGSFLDIGPPGLRQYALQLSSTRTDAPGGMNQAMSVFASVTSAPVLSLGGITLSPHANLANVAWNLMRAR